MSTLDKLRDLNSTELAKVPGDKKQIKPFRHFQEEAIISLALDHTEFFMSVSHFLKPEMFQRIEARWVIAEILNLFEKFNTIPTRQILREYIENTLTEDDPYEEVLRLVDRKSDYREVPIVKELLLNWARKKAFGMIYTPEAIAAYKGGNYEHIEKLFNDANKIVDVGNNSGLWFFENLAMLLEPSLVEHRTTGFARLDKYLNNGGPSPKEVVCWLAATNVGKSILLCNNAMSSLKGPGPNGTVGQDVLLITYELDVFKTALRCLAATTKLPLDQLTSHKELVTRTVASIQNTYKKRFYIYEWPPDECSVNHIYALLTNLKRTQGWKPDVIIIDYMDLMVSRNAKYNSDDYTRQKHVATEIRGLAKNENVLIFTATQTNRGGMDDDAVVDLNKAAESYGKQFALDYVVSLNQSTNERTQDPAQLRFFIAKNRNGPKHEIITCNIDYKTMVVEESQRQSATLPTRTVDNQKTKKRKT